MSTSNPAQSEQEIPSLRDLVGFELPALTCHFPPVTNTHAESIKYTLDGNDKQLEQLRRAASNSIFTITSGIEAISDLLIVIDVNCPDELNVQSRIGANSLIHCLAPLLQDLSDMSRQLEKATAALGGAE